LIWVKVSSQSQCRAASTAMTCHSEEQQGWGWDVRRQRPTCCWGAEPKVGKANGALLGASRGELTACIAGMARQHQHDIHLKYHAVSL